MHRPLYLDNHATTPLDPLVWAAMTPYFTEQFGNAGSAHQYGWEADGAVKAARTTIAEGIGAIPAEIIFTSGATEANNLALKGLAEAYFPQGKKHLITVATEHQAVLEPCRYLESLGFGVTYLPVTKNGLVDLGALGAAIRPDTLVVSVMAANNEIGVLQPLAAIGQLCRDRQVFFHTDAAQAIAKIPLDVVALNIDLLSFTAHKIHGPKGIGGLYCRQSWRSGLPPVKLAPQIQGGGQEQGLRSGTLCVPLIVGMAKAIELGLATMASEAERQRHLREKLWAGLSQLPGIYLNGDRHQRLPGNLNISIDGVQGNALLLALQPHVALSSGSACAGQSGRPSHVLTAIGRDKFLAQASLRFGLSRFTTAAEIDQVIVLVTETVQALRAGFSG